MTTTNRRDRDRPKQQLALQLCAAPPLPSEPAARACLVQLVARLHHLLEICGLVGARVLDAEGAYDPSVPNDRLLLGLKGTMSEFELTLMRRRLVEGAQAKARRGEYRIGVPIGYRWSHEHGLDMDPGRRVQEAIRSIFRLFARF